METLKSGISGLYIKPLYPNLNDTVIIRAFAEADRVNNLRIAFINFDNIDRVYMRKAGVYSLFDGSYDVYEAEIKACNKEIRYWFEAELSNGSDFYLTKRGPAGRRLCFKNKSECAFMGAGDCLLSDFS